MSQSNLTRIGFPDRHVGHTDRKTLLMPWDAAPGTARQLLFDTRWTESTQGEVPKHSERRILEGEAPAFGGPFEQDGLRSCMVAAETRHQTCWH
jgi:hypothetical protein